jgi:hypothetical protein
MATPLLGSSFASLLGLITWVALPLYAVAVGLALAHSRPHTADESAVPEGGQGTSTLLAQLFLFGGSLALIALYRGHEGPLAQGQLFLGAGPLRLQAAALGLGLVGLGFAAPASGYRALANPTLGLRPGALAPLMMALWSLLPLVTHLSTALLVLELVGAALVWAIASTPSRGAHPGPTGAPLGLANGVVLFVWASGLSALSLLITLGLSGLGSGLGGSTPLGLGSPQGFLGGALVAVVISFKFLVGGGQFLLMAWYRYLPPEALVFYLTFYYPAHLLVGLAVLVGLSLAHLQAALSLLLVGLGGGLLALAPHLGVQSSPALTLAGSSFVGLALIFLGVGL